MRNLLREAGVPTNGCPLVLLWLAVAEESVSSRASANPTNWTSEAADRASVTFPRSELDGSAYKPSPELSRTMFALNQNNVIHPTLYGRVMAPTIERLEAMSDSELRATYNEVAENTSVGLEWYREELRRREAKRQADRLTLLTWIIAGLTLVNAIFVIYTVIEYRRSSSRATTARRSLRGERWPLSGAVGRGETTPRSPREQVSR